jgi:Tfp pilus assembly protein PilF
LAIAQLYGEKKMYARAREFVEAGLERSPDNPRLQFQLAALYERQDKVGDAEAQFHKLLKANPSNAGVLNYLGYMLADRGLRLQEALSYVEKAVELEPDNGAFLDSLGWTYFKLNQLKSAEFNLMQAAEINKSDPTILEHLGDLYLRLQDYSRARAYYERSIKFAEDPAERTKVEKKLSSLDRLLSDPPN